MNKLLVFILSLCFLVSCSTAKEIQQSNFVSPGAQKYADNLFLKALENKALENIKEAFDSFQKCVQFDPYNDAAHYEIARIHFAGNNLAGARYSIERALEMDAANPWYLIYYFEIASKQNEYELSLNILDRLIALKPRDEVYYQEKVNLLLHASKMEKALVAIDEMDDQFGVSKESAMRREEIYRADKKHDEAIATIEKYTSKDPKNLDNMLLMAQTYQKNFQKEKAIAILQEVAERDPNNGAVLMNLANHYAQEGNKEKQHYYQQLAFESTKVSFDNKIRMLFKYIQFIGKDDRIVNEMLQLCDILIKVHPKESNAFGIYGEILFQLDQLEKSIVMFKKSLDISSDQFNYWSLLMNAEAQMHHYDSLNYHAHQSIKKFPNQNNSYYMRGFALNQLDSFEVAVNVLKKGLAITFDDVAMETELNSLLGDAYQHLNDYPNSDIHYTKAIELDSTNVFILNNYSYYLSLRKEHLEKAKEYSARSNRIEPGSMSFEDTYAWILFQLKDYEEALLWIEKAILHGGSTNGIIIEHKGDILFQLGKVEEALKHWEMAKDLGGTSDYIERKIQDKKYYE